MLGLDSKKNIDTTSVYDKACITFYKMITQNKGPDRSRCSTDL